MIAVACLTVIALGVLAALVVQQRSHQEAQAQWAAERRELLNRIQRPELVPAGVPSEFVIPEREVDEYEKVGQIEIDDRYGLSDDG